MTTPGMDEVLDALRATTGVGAELALQEFAHRAFDTERKEDGSPVTSADVEVEERMLARLAELAPGIPAVGEESVHGLGGDTPGEYIAIDPIDGTSNFVRGVPFFAITAVYVESGRAMVGVVVDPIHDRSYWAVRGGGAFRDGTRLRLPAEATARSLGRATVALAAESLPRHLKGQFLPRIAGRVSRVQALRAVALETVGLAAGWSDAAIFNNIAVWDIAAASLILEEAGGAWSRLDAGERDFTTFHHHYSFVGAARPDLLEEVMALIQRHTPSATG